MYNARSALSAATAPTYEPLCDARAESLRVRARNGHLRPEPLDRLMEEAWVIGWAEGCEVRNRMAKGEAA